MLSLIAPVALFLAAPDSDVELVDYTVKEGDSCASIAKHYFGDRKAYDRIHEHNPGMGPTPHTLVPGTVLKLPQVKTRPDATVTATARRVEARSPSATAWKVALQGFELFRGWRVSTHDQSFAEVTFRDASRIYMRENTLVIIYGGSEGASRRSSTTARLDEGALRSKLGELSGGKSLTVETPSANTELEGGSSLISVDAEGTSRVANHGGGKAKVQSDKVGKPVDVPERMGSKVRKGKAPSPPKPLPDTPTWAADNPRTFVVPVGTTGTMAGAWSKVAKAETYRVEIGRMAQGGFVMTSAEVPKDAERFEVHGLPPGEYFATVAAVDDDAFESPPSRLYEADLVTARLFGPGGDEIAVPAPDEGKPLAPVRVLPGAHLEAPSGMTCAIEQPGDGVATGLRQVRCTDAEGKAAGAFAIDVVAVKVAPEGEGDAAFTVRRGEPTPLDLRLSAEADLPEDLTVTAPAGFEVGAMTRAEDGHWTVEVTAGPEATTPATFDLVVAGTEVALAEFPVTVVDADAPLDPAGETPKKPDRDLHMIEAGAYVGFISMSTNHELLTTDSPLARDRRIAPISPDVGVRVGYYPVRTFGIELEGGLMPTRLREGSDVLLFEGRASLIAQMPGRVTPYLLLGGGVTGLTSDPSVLGDDTDASFHWGGGVKFFATRHIAVRLGLRDVVLASTGNRGSSHSPQLLLGISGVFRRSTVGKKQ